jgi:tryptophanyl-tRNA synthetase
MKNDRYLTGITTTGAPHLGNYVGAIRPAIEASHLPHSQSFYFLADYHALIKCQDPEVIYQSTKEIAATWLALGLDPENAIFYRQTDIPEITELAWILSCVAAKGLLNRSHAYKAAVQSNTDNDRDADYAVTMGLYGYPVLMSADILAFGGNKIPVGKDQIQHVEMARDMAQRFNHIYGEAFVLPEAVIDEKTAVLSGLDGRKMSKSYGNTIPLFCTEKKLKKGINKIKTNLLEPGEKKDINDSTVFEFWKAFASDDEIEYMKDQFDTGISWGQAKQELFVLINDKIVDARERYEDYMKNPSQIEDILQFGASRARKFSQPLVQKVRDLVGIRSLA